MYNRRTAGGTAIMWAPVSRGAVANHKGFAQFSNPDSWPLTWRPRTFF